MHLPSAMCASCMLHRKLLRGLWGCVDGSLVVVMAVPSVVGVLCVLGTRLPNGQMPICPVSAVCKTHANSGCAWFI